MLFKKIHTKQMPLNRRPANKRIAAVLVAVVMAVSAAGLGGCAQNETTASAANVSYYTNSKAIEIVVYEQYDTEDHSSELSSNTRFYALESPSTESLGTACDIHKCDYDAKNHQEYKDTNIP